MNGQPTPYATSTFRFSIKDTHARSIRSFAHAVCALLSGFTATGCGDLLGFGDYNAICGPESGSAGGGSRVWMARLGDSGAQKATSIVADKDNNVLVAGTFSSTLDAGGELLSSTDGQDSFVVKLDPDGRHLWSKKLGGPGYQAATNIAVDDNGNVIVLGELNGEIDICGAPLKALSEDSAAAAGETAADLEKDIFVVALSPDGQCLWGSAFGGIGEQSATGLSIDENGGIYVAGTIDGTADFGEKCGLAKSTADSNAVAFYLSGKGQCQWVRNLDFGANDTAKSITLDTAGRAWMIGSCEQGGLSPCDGSGTSHLLLVRTGESDNAPWAFGGAGEHEGEGISAIGKDGLVLAGTFSGALDFGGDTPLSAPGSLDIFLASTAVDADGIPVLGSGWSAQFGGGRQQHGTSVVVAPNGDIALTGWYVGELDFGAGPLPEVTTPQGEVLEKHAGFVAAFDETGAALWSLSLGDGESGSVTPYALTLDKNGDVLLAGELTGALLCGDDENGGTLESNGDSDLLIAKLHL